MVIAFRCSELVDFNQSKNRLGGLTVVLMSPDYVQTDRYSYQCQSKLINIPGGRTALIGIKSWQNLSSLSGQIFTLSSPYYENAVYFDSTNTEFFTQSHYGVNIDLTYANSLLETAIWALKIQGTRMTTGSAIETISFICVINNFRGK